MASKRLTDLTEETDPASTDVVAIDGATTRKTTRANLLKENLEAIRGLTSAADKGIQFTGAGTAAVFDLTSAGKALLDDADAAAQQTTLGLVIGTNVQAYDASLADVAGVTFAQGDVLYHNGTNLVALGAGASGDFLKTQGAGANPIWDSVPGGGDVLASNQLTDVNVLATGIGAVARTAASKLQDVVHVKDYGAKADYTTVTATVSITSGLAALTATGAAFTSADVGKMILVPGAGAAGGVLNTTISAFTDATHVTLTANAGTTVSAVSKVVSYATNDLTAIQAALNTGKVVRLPDTATCAVSGTLTMVNAGGLVGSHTYQSGLISFSASAPLLSVPDNVSHLTIGSCGLFRAVTATSGGDGIVFVGSTALTVIDNMWIEGHWNGVSLSHTATSRISNMIITNNQNDGLRMVNKADQTGYQWLMDNILCQMNGARGFLIGSVACSMAGGNSCANMTRLATFANNQQGFYAAGLSAVPIHGLRISNSFFGEDGADEVLLDTHGATHVFTHVYTEIAGTRTTGPTLAVAASNVGSGFNLTGNNTDIELVNCISKGNSVYGLVSQALSLAMIGGSYTFNGAAGAQPGIFIRAGKNRIVGVRSGAGLQTFGIVFDAAAIDAVYTGCDLTGNSGGAAFSSSSGTIKIGDNLP